MTVLFEGDPSAAIVFSFKIFAVNEENLLSLVAVLLLFEGKISSVTILKVLKGDTSEVIVLTCKG